MRRPKILFILTAAGLLFGAVFSVSHGHTPKPNQAPADKWFVIRIDDKTVGYLHAIRKASENADAPILFEHERLIDWKDERMRLKTRTYCQDDHYYYPVKSMATIEQPGKMTAQVTVKMQKAVPYACSKSTMKLIYHNGVKEYKLNKNLPPHVVSEYTLLEIVPTLPFVKGTVFEFNFMILEKLKVKKKHKITYLGLDKVQIKGTQQTLHKFEQKGGGIKKVQFWVNDQRQLLRVLKGGKEELLTSTRAEARRVVVGW